MLPRRWVIERAFAWILRNRRMSRDYEFLAETTEALIYLAIDQADGKQAGEGGRVKASQTPSKKFGARA